jgi:sterol-4alpha-carboxylate 3-dehydrogenase (decarboxylating)
MSASPPQEVTRNLGHVLVTGGTGFLGSTIVNLLNDREACTKITVLDLRPSANPVAGVEYSFGDITDYDAMLALFRKIKPDAVIHTASPNANVKIDELMYKVNVGGTKTMVRASQETGVKAFVYTSSASIIHDTRSNLICADETYPIIMGKDQPQYYTTTKAQAELHVLASNRTASHPNFLTAAIRPSAMFGAGDVQLLPPMMASYYRGQAKFQLGDNENLFDYTEITNIAHAHHLALAALLATHERTTAGQAIPLEHERVDGEAFLITNDQPVYFFDFARRCWAEMGDATDPKSAWALSRDMSLFIAFLLEWIFWVLRKGEPTLTTQRVTYACVARYFNIDKAKRRLGYRPIVSLEEGIRRGVRDALYRGVIAGQPQEYKGNAEILKFGVPGAKVRSS